MSAAVHRRVHCILDGQWRSFREIFEDVHCSSEAIRAELQEMLASGELISRPTNARGGVEYARAAEPRCEHPSREQMAAFLAGGRGRPVAVNGAGNGRGHHGSAERGGLTG